MASKARLATSRDGCIAHIARVAYEAERGFGAELGDRSQLAWSKASAATRAEAIEAVRFLIENPAAGPVQFHNHCRRRKAADGWKHGRKFDAAKKRDPMMKPFEELSAERRLTDSAIIGVVRALEPMLDQAEG